MKSNRIFPPNFREAGCRGAPIARTLHLCVLVLQQTAASSSVCQEYDVDCHRRPPFAPSRLHGIAPLDVTAACPSTAAGSLTSKQRSDCLLWSGLDGGHNEFVTPKEQRGALNSVDARAAAAAGSARMTSKWQPSNQTMRQCARVSPANDIALK